MIKEISRNGIYLDITKSKYTYEVNYYSGSQNYSVKYYFSSKFYLENFKNRVFDNRVKINTSLSKRFHVKISVSILADYVLYNNIEKRGSLVEVNGKPLNLKDISFNLLQIISR